MTKTVESQAPALRVTWTTPQSDVAISQYQVEYRRSGTTSWDNATTLSVSSLVTSIILTGLDAGTEYTVRVRAVSAVGHGNWSVQQTGGTFCSEFYAPSTSEENSSALLAHVLYRPTIVSFDQCSSTCWCDVILLHVMYAFCRIFIIIIRTQSIVPISYCDMRALVYRHFL